MFKQIVKQTDRKAEGERDREKERERESRTGRYLILGMPESAFGNVNYLVSYSLIYDFVYVYVPFRLTEQPNNACSFRLIG